MMTARTTTDMIGNTGKMVLVPWRVKEENIGDRKRKPYTRATFVCLFRFLMFSSAARLSRGQDPRLTSDNFPCCHIETEREDHDLCLSQSHYTETDPTSRERAQRSNSRVSDQVLHPLPTELPPHPHKK